MGAPVCAVDQSPPPGAPSARTLPSIPQARAGDWASTTQSVNAMRQFILNMMQPVNVNNTRNININSRANAQKKKGGGVQTGRWVEVSRVSQRVRVYNPKDKTQYVDIVRINRLVMRSVLTGETWVWNRGG